MNHSISKKTLFVSMTLLIAECLIVLLLFSRCQNPGNTEVDKEGENIILPSIYAASRAEQIRAKLLDKDNKEVLVVAHRADWRNAPENSIEAIESAIQMGVHMVEIDVRKTKDNELVIIHDKTLDRTTNGSGKVSDWTLDSLKTLYLRNGQGRVTRFKIPTLEEALLTAKGKVLVNLDKSYDYFDQVFEIMEATGTTNQVVMKAKKPYNVVREEFGQYLDKVLFMPIIDLSTSSATQWIDEYLEQDVPVAFELVFSEDKFLTKNVIDRLTEAGSKIWINSLWSNLNGGHSDDLALSDIPGSYGWIIDHKATLIQTDRPEYLIESLKKL